MYDVTKIEANAYQIFEDFPSFVLPVLCRPSKYPIIDKGRIEFPNCLHILLRSLITSTTLLVYDDKLRNRLDTMV
jgi:hypothetical protein